MALFEDNSEAHTERPTKRRRQLARERGRVAHSVELLSAARLLAIWIVLAGWLVKFATSAADSLREALQYAGPITSRPSNALIQIRNLAWNVIAIESWPLLMVSIALLVAHFAQVGWLWRWENTAPHASRLFPFARLQRLISVETIGRVLKVTVKLAVTAASIGFTLSTFTPMQHSTDSMNVAEQLSTFGTSSIRLTASFAIVMLTYGAMDYLWQRWRFERSLRMTREEIREELKESEGNPSWRGQRSSNPKEFTATATALQTNLELPNHSARGYV